MLRLKNALVRFGKDESGAALAEYAVTFLVIATVATVGLLTLGTNLSDAFAAIAGWVATNITALF